MAAARKDKNARDRELLAKRRAGFLAVVRKLGVEREWERLPLGLRNRLYVLKPRRSEVELAPEVAGLPRAEEVRRSIAAVLDVPVLDVMGNGQKLSWNEMWWAVLTLCSAFGPLRQPTGVAGEFARALGVVATEEAFELFGKLEEALGPRLMLATQLMSRIDERVYGAKFRSRKETDPYADGREVVVYAAEPRRRTFATGGVSRPAHQVGAALAHVGVVWVEWEREKLGLGPGARLPVYVQRHVTQRIAERLPKGKEHRDAMHLLMCTAVFKAEVVQQAGGTYWVAFEDFHGNRLGYLLAEVVDGAVLVRTFQFLTMEGSPEARRLYRVLGARRADMEALKLDQLATFVETDVERDAELREIFERCGCGHLFDLRRTWGWEENADTTTAAWVKRYFDLRHKGGARAA